MIGARLPMFTHRFTSSFSKHRTNATTSLEFLTSIGRNCAEHASKFPTLQALLDCKSEAMKAQAIPTEKRKYILSRIEQQRKGIEITRIELPVREKRYLKVKAFITLERMRRGGNA